MNGQLNTGSLTRRTRVLAEDNEIREVWMTEMPLVVVHYIHKKEEA